MAYFHNRTVNLLNLHSAIHAVALSGGGAFYAVYLLRAGVPVTVTLVLLAAILAGRFLIRPLLIGLAIRWGLKTMVVAGSLLSAVQYPFLAEVNGVGLELLGLIAITAVGDTVYWSTYHAYFAALGDDDHRGSQLGAREAIGALIGVASPLVTGWLLTVVGPRVAFGLTGLAAAASALPILWTPAVAIAAKAPNAFKTALPGFLLFVADGWIAAGYVIVWQIALFRALGEDYLIYGGSLALAALAAAVAGLVLGRFLDAGHGRKIVAIAFAGFSLIIVLRAVAVARQDFVVAASALGAVGACLYIPTMMTTVYTLAKRSACPLRFHVVTEGGWDIGGASGLLASAALIACGAPLWCGIVLSLAGVVVMIVVLRRYYDDAPSAEPVREHP